MCVRFTQLHICYVKEFQTLKYEEKYIVYMSKGNSTTVQAFQLLKIDGGYTDRHADLR